MTLFAIATIVSLLSAPLSAQWVNLPTPGIPRTANGKPSLTAPAPHTADGKPDLSGLWQRISPKYYENITADFKPGEVPPWAEALVENRKENLHKEHMSLQCLPSGPNYSNSGRMTKIIQTPSMVLMLDDALVYRQILELPGSSLRFATLAQRHDSLWAMFPSIERRVANEETIPDCSGPRPPADAAVG